MDERVRKGLDQFFQAFLQRRGWDRSYIEGPVDADGNPVPWITYPAQSILAQIVRPDSRVFEYGCGHSSLWWAARAKEVVSVDHDANWVARINEKKPDNLTLLSRPRYHPPGEIPRHLMTAYNAISKVQPVSEDDRHNVNHGLNCPDFLGYAATLLDWPQSYFDIIVVDGMARAPCCYFAGTWVNAHGIVVVDNADRWQYSAGLEALRDLGFGRIDFFGPGPGLGYESCTSIFARSMQTFLTVPPREKQKVDIDWARPHAVPSAAVPTHRPQPDQRGQPERPNMKTAAVTFAYNEVFNLPIWVRYFGGQLGTKNLFVVDHGTNDGSTDNLGDVNKIAIPREEFDDSAKTNFVNRLQQGLLNFYDTVIYTDADELVAPDPALYPDLRTYLEQKEFDYTSCVGLNVVHMLNLEEPLELGKPILQQRRFARFLSAACKPAVTRVPLNWSPGFHSSDKPPKIDPALFLFHNRSMDYNLMMQRHKLRRETTFSKQNIERGMGAHFLYDYDRAVREGFFDAINVMTQRGVAKFDFSEEIAAIDAATIPGDGVYFIPMGISKMVEIPERFRSVY